MNKELLTLRKYRLIQEITHLEDEGSISKLEEQMAVLHQKDKFWEAVKPFRKSVSLDQMLAEQAYIPVQKEEFFRKTKKLKIEEPLEELLSMLKS